jgi:FixJ family two-component response regulator
MNSPAHTVKSVFQTLEENHCMTESFCPETIGSLRAQGFEPVVYIVDDEASICQALSRLLRSYDIRCETFSDPQHFLDQPRSLQPCCLLLDVNLAQGDGFSLQDEMNQRGLMLPIIFITGFGTIPMSVRAMKAGAHEFLTKPFNEEELLQVVVQALQLDAGRLAYRLETEALRQRYQSLTKREKEVLELILSSHMVKQIAFTLNISEITAKVHKRHVLTKMKARTPLELLKIYERLQP